MGHCRNHWSFTHLRNLSVANADIQFLNESALHFLYGNRCLSKLLPSAGGNDVTWTEVWTKDLICHLDLRHRPNKILIFLKIANQSHQFDSSHRINCYQLFEFVWLLQTPAFRMPHQAHQPPLPQAYNITSYEQKKAGTLTALTLSVYPDTFSLVSTSKQGSPMRSGIAVS